VNDTIRIGIIGASPIGGGRASHVPAIEATPGLELTAVGARGRDSAVAAARGFGVAKAYGDTDDLLADTDIDLIAVVTSVPGHHDLILAALAAAST
jgi:predicted dehydrogenase